MRGKPRRGRAGIRPQGLCSRGRGGSLLVPQPDRGPRAKAAPEAPPLPPRGLQPASRCPAAACLRPPCGDYRCTWPRLAPPRPPPGPGRLRTPTGAAERVAKAGTEGILRRRAPAEATAAGSARRRAHAREGEEEGGRAAGRGRARPVCEGESEGRAIPGRRKAAAAAASLGSGQASGHKRCRAGRYGGRCRLEASFLFLPAPCPPFPLLFLSFPTVRRGRSLSAARSRGVSAAPEPAAAAGRAGPSPPRPGLRDPPLRPGLG